MEFTVERQKTNNQCSTCPNIDEWKSVVTVNGKTVISMHGYDPTDELTEKQAKLLSGEAESKSGFIETPKCNNTATWQLVSLDDAKAILAELDNEVASNPNQTELDALAVELVAFEAIPTKQRTDKDRSEIKRIKNRINYLNRKA
jgi:hypothetical protein